MRTEDEMSAFDTEDLKSEINTIINKSGELMETNNKSINKSTPLKGILKSPNISFDVCESKKITHQELLSQSSQSDVIPRPHTLKDFEQKKVLTEITHLQSTFLYEDITEDDELWIMDIPGTVDPMQLKGQVLQLGEKSKFKIGEERYSAINKNSKSSFTCVFKMNSTPKLKTVNIKPAGTISIRRKLSGTSKTKPEFEKTGGVPYPKNIKIRHPFFGVQNEENKIST